MECSGLGTTIEERDSWEMSVDVKDAGEGGLKIERLFVVVGYSVL